MPLTSFFKRFAADQRGNVAIICAVSILPMLVIAGGATDIARHEAYRVQLQDGVDRAVLAAASLTQTRPVEETINEYLKSVSFIDDVEVDFTPVVTFNSREVTVTASYEMATGFLPLIGINSLNVRASGTAKERKSNIEISLVLDISGSMREGKPTKIDLLRPAAKDFIDALVTTQTAPYTSLSVVPYAGSVNPGALIYDGLGVPRKHSYSSCMEFALNDYGVGLVPFSQRTQVPHFTNSHQGVGFSGKNKLNQNYTGLEWSWCPYEQTAITYLSNDAAALKAKIDNMKMHDGTGTAIAMNWGMMLLEPAARPLVAQAAAAGIVPSEFAARPANFNDANTVKVIVLMTDGEISDQYRPKVYDYPRTPAVSNTTAQNRASALSKMYAVCNRAKTNNVIVYTIGFQLRDSVANELKMKNELRACASGSSYYYDVTGLDIAAAFQSIATSIQKIRLTN